MDGIFFGRPVRGLERRFVEMDDIMPSSDIRGASVEMPDSMYAYVYA